MQSHLIIPFGEGEGEGKALSALIRRVCKEIGQTQPERAFIKVADAWRVGHLQSLKKDKWLKWKKQLQVAHRTRGAAAVLLVLDGDWPGAIGKSPLCPGVVAAEMVAAAYEVGAGKAFTVAVVIARQEMESWFIAGAESLKGDVGGRPGLKMGAQIPQGSLEDAPRDAKEWLRRNMGSGYKPTLDQERFANHINLEQIRSRKMRSFQRFENAVREVYEAITSNLHVATPGQSIRQIRP